MWQNTMMIQQTYISMQLSDSSKCILLNTCNTAQTQGYEPQYQEQFPSSGYFIFIKKDPLYT